MTFIKWNPIISFVDHYIVSPQPDCSPNSFCHESTI